MEEELHERPLYRQFAGLMGSRRIPDETINAGLADHGLMLKTETQSDLKLSAATSNTKNSSGTRDPEMHQRKKGNQWHFGMKAHIDADAESGLVHTVIGTAAYISDVTQAAGLLHGEETDTVGDAVHQGLAKREEAKDLGVNGHVASGGLNFLSVAIRHCAVSF